MSASATGTTWWLYLLACADGRTYAGIAIDLEARFRLPLRAEYALKQLNKTDKLRWAERWSLPASVGYNDKI
jgi:predicted GIY-YIG superfamily endonuclease